MRFSTFLIVGTGGFALGSTVTLRTLMRSKTFRETILETASRNMHKFVYENSPPKTWAEPDPKTRYYQKA